MDFVNSIILLLNYIFVPALSYGSQLALGAIFVTLIYGILRFANFATGDMMSFGTMFVILFTWYFQSIGISIGVFPTALLATLLEALLEPIDDLDPDARPLEILYLADRLAVMGPADVVAPRIEWVYKESTDPVARPALQCLLWQWFGDTRFMRN
mgnify:CR=1 FL=1